MIDTVGAVNDILFGDVGFTAATVIVATASGLSTSTLTCGAVIAPTEGGVAVTVGKVGTLGAGVLTVILGTLGTSTFTSTVLDTTGMLGFNGTTLTPKSIST
ncbi:hypothetical protein, partial [Fusobacterium sp. PH5-29]|uniref:hypothetical protein n=1 Tax=Fusobacterium sp. PH5-29 TaxID=1742400 RepID=UPI003D1FC261